MKKIVVALCALATVGIVACKKDNPTPTPEPTPSQGQRDLREGVYDPGCKIVRVSYSNDDAPETWLWDSGTGRLSSVNDDDMCGGYTERIGFAYRTDGRVDNVNMSNISLGDLMPDVSLSGTMHVDYSGEYISSLTVSSEGTQVLAAQVQHNNAKKVSGASIDLSDNMLVDIFNSMLAGFLVDSTGSSDNLEVSVDEVSGNVAFAWDGDNVSQATLHIGFRVTTTVGTLVNLVGEDNLGMFGDYGSTLSLLASMFPNQPLYFNISVGDTVSYTYDNQVNPFRNYLGRVHISALTANNVLSEQHTGSAGISISTSYAGQNMQLYQTSYPLPLNPVAYDYLEYNASGCPLRVMDNDGKETYYQYAE